MGPIERFDLTAKLWHWQSSKPGTGWYFLTVDGQTAAEIRYAALGRTGGFGSIKVDACIGDTSWRTSIFPHRDSGGFILPVKAAVRKSEGLAEGDMVRVSLAIAS